MKMLIALSLVLSTSAAFAGKTDKKEEKANVERVPASEAEPFGNFSDGTLVERMTGGSNTVIYQIKDKTTGRKCYIASTSASSDNSPSTSIACQ